MPCFLLLVDRFLVLVGAITMTFLSKIQLKGLQLAMSHHETQQCKAVYHQHIITEINAMPPESISKWQHVMIEKW